TTPNRPPWHRRATWSRWWHSPPRQRRYPLAPGPQVHTCDVAAGRTVCTFPLTLGSFSATMTRSGATVATALSSADVTESPYTQDLQYRVVGGLR
ncbi:MAG TPA: hypothetical protein VGC05_03790, partial [Mycobacterium sp.]